MIVKPHFSVNDAGARPESGQRFNDERENRQVRSLPGRL